MGKARSEKSPLSEVALRCNKIEKYNIVNVGSFDNVY
jgi:pyruvoyl-dependent arginine decarboxylase (PvlArgDC)